MEHEPLTDGRAAWAQALDLQKHFNDILFRIRSLAFAFGGAAAGVLLARAADPTKVADVARMLDRGRWLGLTAPWFALYIVDRLYYHELLRAAVGFAEDVERRGEAPPLCTALTRANRQTGFGRIKVSLFYWLPLAGLTYAVSSDWKTAAVTVVPFLGVEGAAALSACLSVK